MRGRSIQIAGLVVAVLIGVALAVLPQYSTLIVLLVLVPLFLVVGLRYPESLIAIFLTAGFYKTIIPLPVDVTILAAVGLIVLSALRLGRDGGVRVPVPVWGFVACSLLVLAGIFQSDVSAYGIDKALRFATLGAVAVFAPMILIRTERSLIHLSGWLLAVGIAMSVAAVVSGGDPLAGGRYTALGSNTIALGRVSALALAVLVIAAIWNGRLRVLALLAALLPALALLGSGSRGPALAVGLAFLFLMGVKVLSPTTGRVRSVAIGALVALLLVAAVAMAPTVSLERFDLLFEGGGGQSGASRLVLLGDAATMFAQSPLAGAGTGAFAVRHGSLSYPHNIVAELAAENGLIATAAMLLFLIGAFVAAVSRVWKRPGYCSDLMLVVIVSSLVNALVSGDLNANRLLYAFATIALVLAVTKGEEPCTDVLE